MAQQNDRLRGARLGNFTYTRHALHLGGLSGNLFNIILRNVRGSPADIQLAADALKKSGFINYFGLQRFGNELAPTHEYPPSPPSRAQSPHLRINLCLAEHPADLQRAADALRRYGFCNYFSLVRFQALYSAMI